VVVVRRRAQGGRCCRGGDEERGTARASDAVEEAEQRGTSVEGAVAAEEGRVAGDAEPELADEGGAEEVRGLVRRDAKEDLGDGVVDELRGLARRRHGVLVIGATRVWVGIGGSARREKTTASEQPVSAHRKTGSGISRGLSPVRPITLTFRLIVL